MTPPQDRNADGPRLESADQFEQRQRADGSLDEPDVVDPTADGPLSADEVEQRQRLDGSLVGSAVEGSGDPLTADEIEQRQAAGDDELDDDRDDRGDRDRGYDVDAYDDEP